MWIIFGPTTQSNGPEQTITARSNNAFNFQKKDSVSEQVHYKLKERAILATAQCAC